MDGYVDIEGVWVEEIILTTKFACDYEVCHGACCWANVDSVELEGGTVTDAEAVEIRINRDVISAYCSPEYRSDAKKKPTYRTGGDQFVSLDKEGTCIFMNKERGTCALKLANADRKISFAIPKHCQLYPLCLEFVDDEPFLKLMHTFDSYCVCAYKKGEREGIYLHQFCEEAIRRSLGGSFFKKLDGGVCRRVIGV